MRRRHAKEERPIPLPWASLATPLGGGLWPEQLHILVGNTAAGKTQWCLQVAIYAAQRGTPVLYVALEAGKVEFVARCVSQLSGTPWNRLYYGDDPHLEAVIQQHTAELEALPLFPLFPDPYGFHAGALIPAVQALRDRYSEQTPGDRPLLVILDFLQIVGTEQGQREELRERIGKAAYVGRGLARTHNAAVILASSTAREHYLTLTGRVKKKGGGEEKADPPLGKGDAGRFVGFGKESGEIEYAADTVIVLTREPWPDEKPPRDGTICHVALAKIRGGEQPTWATLHFDGRVFTPPRADEERSILI
jgi:replicative DNA helicase